MKMVIMKNRMEALKAEGVHPICYFACYKQYLINDFLVFFCHFICSVA